MAEKRRINVAVTRARRHLTIVGDSSTVSRDPFLNSLVSYVNECGEVWSAEQYRCQLTGDSILPKIAGKLATRKTAGAKTSHQNAKTSKGTGDDKKSGKNGGKNGDKNTRKNSDDNGATKHSKLKWNWRDTRDKYGTVGDSVIHEEKNGITKESEEKRRKLEEEIQCFLKDDKSLELEFSINLTLEQRFIVHCIAEELGLSHGSKGTGEERFIVVAKTTSPSDSKCTLMSCLSFNVLYTHKTACTQLYLIIILCSIMLSHAYHDIPYIPRYPMRSMISHSFHDIPSIQ